MTTSFACWPRMTGRFLWERGLFRLKATARSVKKGRMKIYGEFWKRVVYA
jgi:hypothetical protein